MSADRLFSVHNVNGTLTNSELAYPWRHERIPIWISGLLSVLVPVLVYLLMALRIRSFWDLNNAVCKDNGVKHCGNSIWISLTSLDHWYKSRNARCHRLPAHR